MNNISDAHAQELTSMGNCLLHYHDSDRVVDHNTLSSLQQIAYVKEVSGDFTVDDRQDFVLVDTSSASVTITLPRIRNGREVEIIKTVSANRVTVIPSGTDTVLGGSGVIIVNRFDAIRLKAVDGIGWVAI